MTMLRRVRRSPVNPGLLRGIRRSFLIDVIRVMPVGSVGLVKMMIVKLNLLFMPRVSLKRLWRFESDAEESVLRGEVY